MSVTTDKWIDSHSDQLVEALRECVMIKSVRDDSTAKAGDKRFASVSKLFLTTLHPSELSPFCFMKSL